LHLVEQVQQVHVSLLEMALMMLQSASITVFIHSYIGRCTVSLLCCELFRHQW